LERWIILISMFLGFAAFRTFLLKREPSETASGAIVMALGIFVNGAAYRFPLHETWGPIYTVGLFLIWLLIMSSFGKNAFHRQLKAKHMNDPIQFFALGTWIAGTSVCGIAIAMNIPEWGWLAWGMAVIAVLLWIYYLVKSIVHFQAIWNPDLSRKVHGIILLPAVSTQSLVLLFKTLCGDLVPNWLMAAVIAFGALLYAIGLMLIIRRFALSRPWNIADEWPNTNCILHGAMSITGLASAVSGAVPPNVIVVIWFWVLLWFLVVESVECLRAVFRIKRYGLTRGIGIYNVSQWSRNFTFGMLYAFTFYMDLSQTAFAQVRALHTLKSAIMDYGAWVVLALLVNECLLFFKAKLRWEKRLLPTEINGQSRGI